MKKFEALQEAFSSVGGILERTNYCGQLYNLFIGKGFCEVWVDNLPGGRVSIKVKSFKHKNMAAMIAILLDNRIMHMGVTNTKVDAYQAHRFYGTERGYAARVICSKFWE